MKYEELVKALRRCDMKQGCFNANCRYSVGKYFCDVDKVHKDAAAAIEELDAEETRLLLITSELQDKVMDLQEQLNDADVAADDDRRQIEELEAEVKRLEPKRGEWIGVSPFVDSVQCSECGYCIHSEEFETPYCPWCGAKMMEVQDG